MEMPNKIKIPKAELIEVSKIKEDNTNPNKMSKKGFEALKKTIKKYGFIVPIVSNKDLVIADGFHRYLAAKELNMSYIPTIVLDVNDVDRRTLRQVMNKLKGQHSLELDIEEYKYLFANDYSEELMSLIPDNENEIKKILKTFERDNIPQEEEFIEVTSYERAKNKTKIKKGDIFKLGNHRLMCGDSTLDDMYKLLNKNKINVVITDPPYNTGMSKEKNYGSTRLNHMFNDNFSLEKWENIKSCIFEHSLEHLENGVIYCFFDWRRIDEWIVMSKKYKEFKYSNLIVWDKVVHGLGSDYQYTHEFIGVFKKGKPKIDSHYNKEYKDIWHLQRKVGKTEEHATSKPVELIKIPIKHSTKPKDNVLDLFGGSGSTLIACEQTDRNCYMMELDSVYCQVIIDRWEKYTGKKAEKVN